MDVNVWLALSQKTEADAMLAGINERLIICGLRIARKDAQMLAERRIASLAETERMEFGEPAILAIAEAIADSPCLTQDNAASCLATLQDAFYAVRDEQPIRLSDTEIAETLRNCLDWWGDADTVALLSAEEVMNFSEESTLTSAETDSGKLIIENDKGQPYSFDPDEWAYDEQADGWDGERWADDWDD